MSKKKIEVDLKVNTAQANDQMKKFAQKMGGSSIQGGLSIDTAGLEKVLNSFSSDFKKHIEALKQSLGSSRITGVNRQTTGERPTPKESREDARVEKARIAFNEEGQGQNFQEIAKRIKLQEKAENDRQRKALQFEKKIEVQKDKAQERRIKKAEKEQGKGSFLQYADPQKALKERLLEKHGDKLKANLAEGGDGGGPRKPGRRQGFMGGRFRRGLGVMATGAALQQGSTAIGNMLMTEAQFRNRESLDIMSGRFLEAQTRQKGRKGTLGTSLGVAGGTGGALAGAAAGALAGSFFGPVGMFIGGVAGGAYGAYQGFREGQTLGGEISVERKKIGLEALERAKAIVPQRLQSMAGTGLQATELNRIQTEGAELAYSPQESLNQLNTVRNILGTDFATQVRAGGVSNLQEMQRVQRNLGVNIGTQAGAASIFAGAEGRKADAADLTSQIEVLKKGVAAGLDVSKSGKFLQQSAQVISSITGLGRVDTEAAAERFTAMASAFGGGDITDVSMRQAGQAIQTLRSEQESVFGGGLAAAGNILGAMDAFRGIEGLETTQKLMLSGVADKAVLEDMLKTDEFKNIDDEAKDRIREQFETFKEDKGFKAVSERSGIGRTFLRMSQNQTASTAMGLNRAEDAMSQENLDVGVPDLLRRSVAEGNRVETLLQRDITGTTQEGQFAQRQAQIQDTATRIGLEKLPEATEAAVTSLNTLKTELDAVKTGLASFRDETNLSAKAFRKLINNLELEKLNLEGNK